MLRDGLSASTALCVVAEVVLCLVLHASKTPKSYSSACNTISRSEFFAPLEQRNQAYPFCLSVSFLIKNHHLIKILRQMLYVQAAGTVHVHLFLSYVKADR